MILSPYRYLRGLTLLCATFASIEAQVSAQQITRQLVRLSSDPSQTVIAEFNEAGEFSASGVLQPGKYRLTCTNGAEIFLVPSSSSVTAASQVDMDFILGAAPILFGNTMERRSLFKFVNTNWTNESIFTNDFGVFSDNRSGSSRVEGFFDELHSGNSVLMSETTPDAEGNAVGISWRSFARLFSYSVLNSSEDFNVNHHIVWLFEVQEETAFSLEGVIGNPAEGSSQRSPRMPSGTTPGGGVSFRGAPSGDWMDPETTFAYDFVIDEGSNFTRILNFPTGFSDKFMVTVGETTVGPFSSSESVDFQTHFGSSVSGFRVSGITPNVDGDDPVAFPIRLEFDTETANFTMTPLSEPFVEIESLGNQSIELIFDGVLEQATELNQPELWQVVEGASSPFTFVPQSGDASIFWRATKTYPAPPSP